ncbi:methionyl-tRNA synthetase, partial [mine drainage metagenome]
EILSRYVSPYGEYSSLIRAVEIKKALKLWIDLVQEANAYVNRSEPWKLVKTDLAKCAGKLYTALKMLQALIVMIYPYTPEAAGRCLKIIGFSGTMEQAYSQLSDQEVHFTPLVAEIPFQRIEIRDVNPNSLDLTVGRVEQVENHPEADKLYVLRVS